MRHSDRVACSSRAAQAPSATSECSSCRLVSGPEWTAFGRPNVQRKNMHSLDDMVDSMDANDSWDVVCL